MNITFVHLGREHLGLQYLSSILKEKGHRVFLAYDAGLFGPDDNVFNIPFLESFFNQKKQVVDSICNSAPDLVGFTTYSSTYAWACDIAKAVKQRLKTQTVFGGIHATLVPDTVIKNDFVDYVVIGEGFQALPELVEALMLSKTVNAIDNVWFKDGKTVVRNPLRPALADLDALPLPDKSLFEKDVNYRDDYVIITSRGCVYNCSYCCESSLNRLYGKKYFRRRSADSVIRELEIMKDRYQFKAVMFNDALFFTNKSWLRQLMAQYRKKIAVPFRCFGKVTDLDDETCQILKDSGCYCIEFGMQTVNEELKKRVLNRRETNQQALAAFQRCDKYQLRYDIDHMFGLPGESEADHINALQYYSQLKYLNRIKCHNLTFFPETAIIETACEQGSLDSADMERICQGEITDFFHGDFIKDRSLKVAKENFSKYFKLLPVIPEGVVTASIRFRLYRLVRFIPSPLIILGQLLVAAKGRDYRFIIYLKYYPLRIQRAIKAKLARPRRSAT